MSRGLSQYEVNHMENLMVRDDYWDKWDDDYTDSVICCDLYECKDCPRLGDDCDGIDMEEDDE